MNTGDAQPAPRAVPVVPDGATEQPAARSPAVHLPLYRRVLGAAWDTLDPAVQRAHDAAGDQQATGTFAVTRTPGPFTGLLLTLAGVPAASAAASVRLHVRRTSQDGQDIEGNRSNQIEHWQRAFGDRPLRTRQYATASGLLAEQFGLFEFWFRLSAEGGALRFRQARQFLCLGPVRVPLPAWAAPHIAAREGAGSSADETTVAVRITTPHGALLFAYAGSVRWTLAAPDEHA